MDAETQDRSSWVVRKQQHKQMSENPEQARLERSCSKLLCGNTACFNREFLWAIFVDIGIYVGITWAGLSGLERLRILPVLPLIESYKDAYIYIIYTYMVRKLFYKEVLM